MTTIAYSYEMGLVAYDSRATGGSYIYTDSMEKSVKVDGITFLLAGQCSDREETIAAYFTEDREIREDIVVNAFAIVHKQKKVYMLTAEDGTMSVTEMDHDTCAGSGGHYAITALDCGLTPKEAIKMAAKRDACTGGKIRQVRV